MNYRLKSFLKRNIFYLLAIFAPVAIVIFLGKAWLPFDEGMMMDLNRYQYPRHLPTSLGTAVQILPEKAHCCNYGV